MKTITSFVARLAKDENGATAIEYGLIAALISVAAIVGMKAIGTALNTQFTSIGNTVTNP
ncbi:MAG: Flp family type IVb pilin [Solirubrobacterales bacterium]